MGRPTPDADFLEDVPWSDELTDYDNTHLILYVRLLDACAAGAAKDEIVRVLFGIDPVTQPARAQRTLDSHLKRARWMTERGYRHLLQ